jgi:hypothetical protein
MRSGDLAAYVKDAIVRLTADAVSSQNGSHAAGIFNKAANGFEKRILTYAAADPLRSIIEGSKQVNAPWKRVKHGADPPLTNLLNGLRKMLDVLNKLPL